MTGQAPCSDDRCKVCRQSAREKLVREIVELWNGQGGWIPGGSINELSEILGVTLKTPQQLHHERHVDCGHPDCNPGRALVKVKINVDARPARPAEHIWEEAWNDLLSSIALTRAHGSRTGTSETLIEGRGRQAFRFTRTSSNCQACAFSGVGACDDAPHTFYYIEELA